MKNINNLTRLEAVTTTHKIAINICKISELTSTIYYSKVSIFRAVIVVMNVKSGGWTKICAIFNESKMSKNCHCDSLNSWEGVCIVEVLYVCILNIGLSLWLVTIFILNRSYVGLLDLIE